MRSLFAKILLWFGATVLLTAFGIAITTALTFSRIQPRQGPFSMLVTLQVAEAREAYEQGGREALARKLDQFRRILGADVALTDASGRDLVTGEDRSDEIEAARRRPRSPLFRRQNFVLARRDESGQHWLLLEVSRRRFYTWLAHPQFLPILGLVVLLCYLMARHLTQPVRALQAAVDRFGRGDLRARVGSTRRDELGDLARTFDRMAERIETLLTAERRLLLDISHEIRSPLARLALAVELARSGDDRDKALDRIQKESDRLNELVSELLQVTRAEGDPSTLAVEPVRIDEITRAVVEDAGIEAIARGSSVELPDAPPVKVIGNPLLLRRAIENVLRNAIRFAPPGTAVEVTVEADDMARVRIRDYGPGVPESDLERIFDAFYRVDTHRNRQSGGVGLGLAIAKRAVELHKGTIRARNAGPGLEVEIAVPALVEDASNTFQLLTPQQQ